MTPAAAPTPESIRAEAEERAHDAVTPDAVLNALAAINLYVEAFIAGAKFAAPPMGAPR